MLAKQNQYFPQSTPHPGDTLAEKLEEMEMGPKEFAIRTGKPEKTITAILKGESSITSSMAIQFESVTKIPANFWMNYQTAYDEYVAREKQKEVIQAAAEWTRSFPLTAMVKLGWIPKRNSTQEKTLELLSFFGFANHTAWEKYYFDQQLKVAFRISLASTSQPYSLSAWLRMGELQAAKIPVKPYSEKVFKNALKEIKTVMATHPPDFFQRLQEICKEAGVKVVHTPCLPKAPLNGATRWVNDSPLIQLSGRHKRNDIFWFTFFHEAGHVLKHGKKDIFLEDVEYSDRDLVKEKEADEFAIEWTLTTKQEQQILQAETLDEDVIRRFARKFQTHPGIIIGRLHHKHLLHHSRGTGFFEKISFDPT